MRGTEGEFEAVWAGRVGARAGRAATWQHKGIIVNSAVKARTFNAIVLRRSVARTCF